MKKRYVTFGSFILCLLVNLFMHGYLLLAALACLAAHYLLSLPLFITWIVLGLWVLTALIHTAIVAFANSTQDMNTPGCRCTSERLREKARAEEEMKLQDQNKEDNP